MNNLISELKGVTLDLHGVRLPSFKPKKKEGINVAEGDNYGFLKA